VIRCVLPLLLVSCHAFGATQTDWGQQEQDIQHWSVVTTRPVDRTVASANLELKVYDWDTAGEAAISINGHPYPGTLPSVSNTANNDVEISFSLETPIEWLAPDGTANQILLDWPRDRAAGRALGWGWQAHAIGLTYVVGTLVPSVPSVCMSARYGARPPELAHILIGCYFPDTQVHTTVFIPEDGILAMRLRVYGQTVATADIPPLPILPSWMPAQGNQCDAAFLWAQDEPAGPNGEPAMTRQQKIDAKCNP